MPAKTEFPATAMWEDCSCWCACAAYNTGVMSHETEIIYVAGRIEEAVIVKQMLAERGIDSVIENQSLQGAVGELPAGEATNPRVRVPAEEAEKSREVVKAFEHQQKLARERTVYIDADYDENWPQWPTCPECHRRRQTVCPICKTAGTNLPMADPNHDGEALTLGPTQEQPYGHLPLLICTTCDEPFRPKFYKLCQWCRHEFEDGLPPPPAPLPVERANPRVWAVASVVIGLVAALCGYFWWISR